MSVKAGHLAGAAFTLAAGTLLHFVWEWSGRSRVIALFSAVNESTWEHLKLLFFPFVAFTLVEYLCYGQGCPCFFRSKLRAVVLGMAVIVTVFYTYTGILGTNLLALDIGTFVLGVVCAYRSSYQALTTPGRSCGVLGERAALAALVLLAVLFFVFTFVPPRLGLFAPPAS